MFQLFKPYGKNETTTLLAAIKHDTPYQTVGKSFLQDVFYFGGLINKDPKKIALYEERLDLNISRVDARLYIGCHVLPSTSKLIADFIVNRSANFMQVEYVLQRDTNLNGILVLQHSTDTNSDKDGKLRFVDKTKACQLLNYIVFFCKENGIYWDDAILSTVPEQELIKSYLVYKLNALRCFTSQNP